MNRARPAVRSANLSETLLMAAGVLIVGTVIIAIAHVVLVTALALSHGW